MAALDNEPTKLIIEKMKELAANQGSHLGGLILANIYAYMKYPDYYSRHNQMKQYQATARFWEGQ